MAIRIPKFITDLFGVPAPEEGKYLKWSGSSLVNDAPTASVPADLNVTSVAASGNISAALFGAPGVNQTVLVKAWQNTSAGAVAVAIDNNYNLTTSGAKLLSVRNAGVEKASIDYRGYYFGEGLWTGAGGNGTIYGSLLTLGTGGSLTLKGNATTAANAVGVIVDNAQDLTTAGAKLLSVRNLGVEKLALDKDGKIVWSGGCTYYGTSNAHYFNNGNIYSGYGSLYLGFGNGVGGTIIGEAMDGASAVGLALNNSAALSTAGAKLLSVRNAGVEKAYIDKDGAALFASSIFVGGGGGLVFGRGLQNNSGQFGFYANDASKIASFYAYPGSVWTEKAWIEADGTFGNSLGARIYGVNGAAYFPGSVQTGGSFAGPSSSTAILQSYQADGAASVGTIIRTVSSYATAGAKLLSIRNVDTEVASVDRLGALSVLGSLITPAGVYATNFNAYSNASFIGRGQVGDGVSSVGVVLDNTTNLTATGAKIASFRNATVEKAYIGKDGNFWNNAAVVGGSFWGNTYANVNGQDADGSSSIGVILNAAVAQTVAGAKLASFRNAGVEKAYVNKDGGVVSEGGFQANSGYFVASLGGAYLSANAAGITLQGRSADGASAVNAVIDTFSIPLTVAGSKLLSVKNGGVEKFYIDRQGGGYCTSDFVSAARIAANWMQSASFVGYGNSVTLLGTALDGATAVGVILDNQAALPTAGAKLVSVRNATVEKAYFDKDGKLSTPGLLGTPVAISNISATGTPSATTYLRGDGSWTTPAGGGSGSPGGADTQVQFNDGGAFGGSPYFTFDKATGQIISTGDASSIDATANYGKVTFPFVHKSSDPTQRSTGLGVFQGNSGYCANLYLFGLNGAAAEEHSHILASVAGCVHRSKPITDSGASRSPSPVQADHPFRSKPIAERIAR